MCELVQLVEDQRHEERAERGEDDPDDHERTKGRQPARNAPAADLHPGEAAVPCRPVRPRRGYRRRSTRSTRSGTAQRPRRPHRRGIGKRSGVSSSCPVGYQSSVRSLRSRAIGVSEPTTGSPISTSSSLSFGTSTSTREPNLMKPQTLFCSTACPTFM